MTTHKHNPSFMINNQENKTTLVFLIKSYSCYEKNKTGTSNQFQIRLSLCRNVLPVTPTQHPNTVPQTALTA